MIVLGIESSCDETAAAVVRDGNELLSNIVATSMDLHAAFGGVVPEIAARSHVESIIPVIEEALTEAFGSGNTKYEALNNKQILNSKNEILNNKNDFNPWSMIDAIAVTYGAGLGGSLLVGAMTAKTLAVTKQKPLYAINHVEGHVYANFLTKTTLDNYKLPSSQPKFPVLALIVSGGHSQLVLFRDHFDYTLLGRTRDDAIGEAFDKVAKVIGLPYPGGPSISKAAELGDSLKYQLPKSKLDKPYEFSFSGLKTAVLRLAQEEIGEDFTFPSHKVSERLSETQKNDIAASFQRVAVETVVDKTVKAYEEFLPKSVVIAGGVAANTELRKQLRERLCDLNTKSEARNPKQILNSKYETGKTENEKKTKKVSTKSINIDDILHFTDIKLCTDNGAMIATLGCFKGMLGQSTADPYSLQIEPNLSM